MFVHADTGVAKDDDSKVDKPAAQSEEIEKENKADDRSASPPSDSSVVSSLAADGWLGDDERVEYWNEGKPVTLVLPKPTLQSLARCQSDRWICSQGDFLRADLSDASVIFINNAVFDAPLMDSIMKKIVRLPRLRTVSTHLALPESLSHRTPLHS